MTEPIIPYVPQDIKEPADIVLAIRTRRGGTLINLDRMLLHSPPFARGWNSFLKEVRTNLSVSAKLREIAICSVAVLNRAEYEFFHHAPELLAAGGTQEQVDALRRLGDADATWEMFSSLERDVIALTQAMTCDMTVPASLMTKLHQQLGSQTLVEMVGVVATYNMVSRFLVALGVEPERQDT